MTSQERFEAWAVENLNVEHAANIDYFHPYARQIWQSAERQALERAAQMIEKLADDFAGEYALSF